MGCAVDEHGFRQADAHHYTFCMHGLQMAGLTRASFNTCVTVATAAAANHVGMLPDCHKQGLGVL